MPAQSAAHSAHTELHTAGIVAHVAIWLEPSVDIFNARRDFLNAPRPTGFDVHGVHIGLGEIDCLADVSCAWTQPRGDETRHIGEWINTLRNLNDASGRHYVKRTSTVVCMNMP